MIGLSGGRAVAAPEVTGTRPAPPQDPTPTLRATARGAGF